MTANRVIDDHSELSGVGQIIHTELDAHVSSSAFLLLSSSTNLPPNARYLVTGSGVTLVDDPGSSTLTINVDQNYFRSLFVFQEEVSGLKDGTNNVFSLGTQPYPSQSLMLWVNGALAAQGPGSEYILSGTIITMIYSPPEDSAIFASYPREVS